MNEAKNSKAKRSKEKSGVICSRNQRKAKSATGKRKKGHTSSKRTKIFREVDLSAWRLSQNENKVRSYVVREISKEDNFLEMRYGDRLHVEMIHAKRFNSIIQIEKVEKTLIYEGNTLELVSIKKMDDPNQGKGGQISFHGPQIDKYRAMYVKASVPGRETINVQESLDEIADFSSLNPRKAAVRLQLLQSPAALLENGQYAIFNIKIEDLCEIDEHNHTGCGFICEEYLNSLIPGKTLNTLGSVQIRLYAPSFGLFKGMLMRKRITSGAKIQLPSSMKKVGPSKATNKMQPILLVCNAGIDPSKTNARMKQLPWIDPNGKDIKDKPNGNDGPKKLKDMVQNLLIGLGISKDMVEKYITDARKWSRVNHANLRGVADPTGKIPPDCVYMTGLKNQSTREFIEKHDLFVTRYPVVKCEHSKMVKVMTKRPEGMSQSDYEWLESLPFGNLIFGFPSEGMRPLSEVLDGDMDGDRFLGKSCVIRCKLTLMIDSLCIETKLLILSFN